MNTFEAPDSISLDIPTRSALDSTLNATVQLLTPSAKARRHGILVTRTSPSKFIVSLSPDVPYGTTRERLDWQ